MKFVVTPGSALRGAVDLPGDKSLSHRAALFAALAVGESRIENYLVSGVTRAMLEALSALGVSWQMEGTTLHVRGKGLDGLRGEGLPVSIHCGNSATTLRLLAGALAAAGVSAVLDGSSGLRRRPMDRIVEPLRQMGVSIHSADGCAPLSLEPSSSRLEPLTYSLPVASAQVKSCLLLAALAADGQTVLAEPGPSRDHTERMLRSMGVSVSSEQVEEAVGRGFAPGDQAAGADSQPTQSAEGSYITRLIPPISRTLSPLHLRLPGDISSAAFLIVAALVTPGSEVSLRGVGLNPTRTGLLDALQAMGADIQVTGQTLRSDEPVGDLSVRFSLLHGTRVSGPLVVRMIDEFPAFAVAASFAWGRTLVCDAGELRHKESDRIAALCAQLRLLGVDAQETPDGFAIAGKGKLPGGQAHSCGDHRLAMALSIAGLAAHNPIAVKGAEATGESFPGYVDTLRQLGANIQQTGE